MSSLRVLFFVSRDWYNPATTGGDNSLWEHARYLAAVGHRVTYVASTFPGAIGEESRDGIRVVRLGGIHSLWIRTFLYYMRHCRGKYDIVVTEGFGGSRIPRFAPLYVREPIVTAWHQIHRDLFTAQYPRLLLGPLNLLERVTAWVHRNTRVQAYTQEWKDAFPSIGFKPDNIFVVPVSIREKWLNQSNGHSVIEPNILWIGKLRRYKCADHAVLAMPEVVKHVPTARLLLVARPDDSAFQQKLSDLVTGLHLENNVEFRFDVTEVDSDSAEAKQAVFRAARVMLLPSSVEGFGIVVLEANACGVPVIASSGVPESVVRHGENGLRYDYGDIAQLSRRIVEILTDDALYARLATNSLEFASRFGWRNVSGQFERVLQRAVADEAQRS